MYKTVTIKNLAVVILLAGLPATALSADGVGETAPRLVMPVSEFLEMLNEDAEASQERKAIPESHSSGQQAARMDVSERPAAPVTDTLQQPVNTQPRQVMSVSEFLNLVEGGESSAVNESDVRDTERVQVAEAAIDRQAPQENTLLPNSPLSSTVQDEASAAVSSVIESRSEQTKSISSLRDFLTALPEQPLPPQWRSDTEFFNDSVTSSDLDTIAVRARPAGSLDIVSAVRRAVTSHPSIAEALGRMYEQRERVDVAKAGYYPQVSSGFSSGYRTTTGRSGEALTISASQMLYDFGKVSRAVEVANSRVDRNRAEALLAIDDLARDTANAAIEVQRYQTLLTIAAKQVEAISELKKLAEKRSALGASTRSDEMQAQSRKEAAMATQLQLQAQLDGWKRTLQNLVGSMEPVAVVGEFPPSMSDACWRRFDNFEEVPEIKVADAKRDEALAALKRAESELYPTLSLNADYDYYLNEDRGALSLTEDERIFSVTLNLSSKIFQGGATRAGKRAASRALEVAKAQRQTALLEVSQNLREAKDQTESLTQRLRLLGARYDNIVKTQELYRQQYLSLGTRTLLDILNTEQEIYQSLFEREDTLRDLQRLQIQCLYSTAQIRKAFAIDEHFMQRTSIQP